MGAISGVGPTQRVALQLRESSPTINPGDFAKISSTPGQVARWIPDNDDQRLKYARYLGKEAALLDVNESTPFDETLTVGIVPDQTLTPTTTVDDPANVGWFQLMDSQGGVEV